MSFHVRKKKKKKKKKEKKKTMKQRRASVQAHVLNIRFPFGEGSASDELVKAKPPQPPKSPRPDSTSPLSTTRKEVWKYRKVTLEEAFPAGLDREGRQIPIEDESEWGYTTDRLKPLISCPRYRLLYRTLIEALEGWDAYCTARANATNQKGNLTALDKVKFDAEIRRFYTRRNRKAPPLPEDYRMSPQDEREEDEMTNWARRRQHPSYFDDDVKELSGSNSSCEALPSPVNLPPIERAPLRKAGLEVDLDRLLGFGAHGRVYLGYLNSETETKTIAVKKITVERHKAVAKELEVWQRISATPNKYVVKYYGHTFNRKLSEFSVAMEYCKFGSLQDVINRITSTTLNTSSFFTDDGHFNFSAIDSLYGDSRCSSVCSTMTLSSVSNTSIETQNSVPSRRIRLGLRTIKRILGHVVSGIVSLHGIGVIHRDVKTSNVLIGNDGYIKLCDFGVSIQSSGDNVRRTVVGTPGYLAPEVIEELPYGTPADIWSLGITVLELASGRRPYSSLNKHATIFRTMSEPHPPYPPDLHPTVRSFLDATLVKDPEIRAAAPDLFVHPLVDSACAPLFQ
eukprot:TRINITY_DN834_c0_g4_i1.p1 TRINITY_DN834_c0_g4~~TRINITY_DN834_c0_g4_i1.p1  ORF type:complete len:568 (+),score=79.95 TRINITY_DN834_c0_g4_i1:131-1834(+)